MHSFQTNPELSLQLKQLRPLPPYKQCRRLAAMPGAPCAPDPMDEILGHFREIVVDDVRYVLDVNSS